MSSEEDRCLFTCTPGKWSVCGRKLSAAAPLPVYWEDCFSTFASWWKCKIRMNTLFLSKNMGAWYGSTFFRIDFDFTDFFFFFTALREDREKSVGLLRYNLYPWNFNSQNDSMLSLWIAQAYIALYLWLTNFFFIVAQAKRHIAHVLQPSDYMRTSNQNHHNAHCLVFLQKFT